MTQEILKWKLFSFSLLERAKKWYAHSVGGVNGNWDELRDNICLTFFPLFRIADLRIKILTFKHREKETLGAAWARFTSLTNSGPNLFLPDHVLHYHFYRGLNKEAAPHLDIASGGSFTHKLIDEAGGVLGILNANRKICKRTDTDVAFTREYYRVSIFHRERECTN